MTEHREISFAKRGMSFQTSPPLPRSAGETVVVILAAAMPWSEDG